LSLAASSCFHIPWVPGNRICNEGILSANEIEDAALH